MRHPRALTRIRGTLCCRGLMKERCNQSYSDPCNTAPPIARLRCSRVHIFQEKLFFWGNWSRFSVPRLFPSPARPVPVQPSNFARQLEEQGLNAGPSLLTRGDDLVTRKGEAVPSGIAEFDGVAVRDLCFTQCPVVRASRCHIFEEKKKHNRL